jgi:hypothetical protein
MGWFVVEFSFETRRFCYGIEAVGQLLGILRHADVRVVVEGDALRLHLRHAPVDMMLLHLEVGNAVAQQPSGLARLFEDMDAVPGARQLLGCGHA